MKRRGNNDILCPEYFPFRLSAVSSPAIGWQVHPAAWSTAMLFFHVFLTGGYAYAYWLVRQKRQGWIHAALLVVMVFLLAFLGFFCKSPVTPSVEWKPDIGVTLPILQLFFLLTISVGLPYFMLASIAR